MRGVAALALALAAGACTADVPRGVSSPTGTTTTTADLAALLFDDVPPGYVVVADETRALTLEDVVAGADDAPEARTRLERHGFVRGYSRSWTSDDDSGNVIVAFVYEFRDAEGARADLQSGLDEARADGDTLFDVPGVDGARGVQKDIEPGTEGDDSSYLAVFFVRGERLYLVAIGGPAKHEPDEVIDLAEAMAERAA
ncbi:MAG: DUF7373 family lipoprotein [Actinomycetota bacterium]